MKAFKGKNGDVALCLAEADTRDLMIFLNSELRRRDQKFEAKEIMECWSCQGVIRDMINALKEVEVEECASHGYGPPHEPGGNDEYEN